MSQVVVERGGGVRSGSPGARGAGLAAGLLFALTILLSAFLLFAVQPLIARFILPWFGGAAAVWTTCLLFFQAVLLGGYAYAHLLADRMSPRAQAIVHIVLLLACLALLPIAPSERWAPADASQPTLRVLVLLAVSVGLPYFALAATSPLVQHWFARVLPGWSVYRLYALSNLGSLAALVSYPFVIEPALSRRGQSLGWSWLFAAFAVPCAVSAIIAAKRVRSPAAGEDIAEGGVGADPADDPAAAPPPERAAMTWRSSLLVLLLTGLASALLMSATNEICQQVAPFPFLWVLPLTLYLLAFIFCFEYPRLYWRSIFYPLAAAATLGSTFVMMRRADFSLPVQVAAHSAALVLCCIICLGETMRLRPAARQLTRYYLLVALGGVIGAALVALAAPVVFSHFLELHVSLALTWITALGILLLRRDSALRGFRRPWAWLPAIILLPLLLVGLYFDATFSSPDRIFADRSFYGVLEVIDHRTAEPRNRNRELIHNGIIHGIQFTHDELRRKPKGYYEPFSGIGLTLERFRADRPRRIAVVGLGSGTVAAYGKPGDEITFFELDPGVIEVAHKYFTFLSDSPAKVRTVTGDARLSLAREPRESKYDVIVLDAFSGDAVPVHLLTLEAFELYREHLAEGGVIVAHLSNLHLHLYPPVRVVTHQLGMSAVLLATLMEETPYPSEWLIISTDTRFLDTLRSAPAYRDWPVPQHLKAWTDDHAPLFPVLRGFRGR